VNRAAIEDTHRAGDGALPAPHASPIWRLVCLLLGGLALALGLAGVFLPLLPTTPFILLAAACFARSSRRLYQWLLSRPHAGPIIREWQTHRAMPAGVKPWVHLLMTLSFGTSILTMSSPWHQLMLASLWILLAWMLWRIPVRQPATSRQDSAVRAPDR